MERPKVGVSALVVRAGKILMMRRQGAHGEGTWASPGGHLEYGEEPEQTAARETKEEIGCGVKTWVPLGYTNDIFDGKDKGKHYITLIVGGYLEDGQAPQIMEPDKCVELRWCDMDNLPAPLFKTWERILGKELEQAIRDFVEKSR